MAEKSRSTSTSSFGVGRRESHDASEFYARFVAPEVSDDEDVRRDVVDAAVLTEAALVGDSRDMHHLPDKSVALVITSPPYFVGKEYELAVTGNGGAADDPVRGVPESYLEYLDMLREVFAECVRVLEPGGRIAVNVANLGRKPYRSLSADVIRILQDDLKLLLRGEIIWQKSKAGSGSCVLGSFTRSANPVLRDVTERVIVASKGRFDRALSATARAERGLPSEGRLANDEFVEITRDVWVIDAESATRVGHPAPFPVELPRRLIELYTYKDDIVLDPFMGAGTSLVAAELAERRGVGYDLDPDYVEIARKRLATAREQAGRFRELRAPVTEQTLPLDLSELAHDERREHFQARAVAEGKKAQRIAGELLDEAGFVVEENVKLSAAGVQFNFKVTSADGAHDWYVDVSGAFTTVRPGLMRTDTLWKTLGRIHVLKGVEPEAGVLILTSNLPKPGSEGDKALRTVGPRGIFDAVEMFDPRGRDRLAAYARGQGEQLVGFWTADEIRGSA